jgi:hypothetical protein
MSSINPNNIDGTYPIAGQDNDSQGFRDNFTNIKNNFTFASQEIADLQNNALLKTALSGTTLNNNLLNAQLIGAQISKFTETREDLGTQTGNITVSWNQAHFQTVSLTGNTTVTLSNWPTSGFWTWVVLDITPTIDNLYLTLPTSISSSTENNIQGFSGNAVVLPKGNVAYRFEFSTYDGGTTVSMRDLYRNYSGNTVISGSLTTQGAVINTGVQLYVPTANTQTFTGNVNSNKIIIAPKPSLGASSYQLVTLPNVTTDGTTFSISANVTTYVGTFSPWVSTTVDSGANVAVTGGTSINFIYSSSQSKWFKV